MSEFKIAPGDVEIAQGASINVTNAGTMAHNLAVVDADLTTPDLAGGAKGKLDTSALAPGEYSIICTIAGHADSGMKGTLSVSSEGGDTSGSANGTDTGAAGHDMGGMTEEEMAAMDKAMDDSIKQFPAESEGLGNQPLKPTVLADGTKQFELTAAETEWEVAPGQKVDAYSYNGEVPGPWIKVDVGDKVKVILTNDLPMGTDIHWHGVRVPNDQDGVAPITQPLIKAGDTFTYEFTTERQTLGMYHAHHAGQLQVPNGLFAVFQVGDMPLPAGRTISGQKIPDDVKITQEIPMVTNDAGVIGLTLNGKSFPATAPVVAKKGDWVLIHYFNEGLLAHPMHLHEFEQLVVAKDGIPLDQPYFADTINVAPGERYSVLVHLDVPGTWVWHCHILSHAERESGMFGMVTAIVVEP